MSISFPPPRPVQSTEHSALLQNCITALICECACAELLIKEEDTADSFTDSVCLCTELGEVTGSTDFRATTHCQCHLVLMTQYSSLCG